MKQLTYTLGPPQQRERYASYRKEELERMTLLQLRDICEREEVIHAAVDRMDREELIHLILQFRGSRTPRLILADDGEGQERLQEALGRAIKREIPHGINIPAKLVAYEGLDTGLFDNFAFPYEAELDGVNALVVDNNDEICAVWQAQSFPGRQSLYLTRSGAMPCRLAQVRDYRLFLFPRQLSDQVYQVYTGKLRALPPEVQLYVVPLLDFVVRRPVEITMPLAIDFGTSNTAAGIYIDNFFYSKIKDGIQPGQVEPEAVNYVQFLTTEGESEPIIPTVVGVDRIENGQVVYNIGHEAEKMVAQGYLGDRFCVFYDIKRWVSDVEQEEELSDQGGNRMLVKRSEIIGAFLRYIIDTARQRFKCTFTSVYLSYPVKQKARFLSLYRQLLTDVEIAGDQLIDEGVSVLYSTIARIIDRKSYREGEWYKALVVDCGGGTTDLSSCRFRIRNERVSYNIEIETSYENGDTDFGGNNLTFRMMQLLKIAAARALTGKGASLEEIAAGMDVDIYRAVDEQEGAAEVYKALEEAYALAEEIIPTRFKEYEFHNRDEYYMVRNNFYYLFTLAEKVKKVFFGNPSILEVAVGSERGEEAGGRVRLPAARWKMSARLGGGGLALQKQFPTILLGRPLLDTALHGDIYDIIRRFFDKLYDSGELQSYKIISLTGQSCKIDIFRDCLKEYLPGKLIRGRRERGERDYRLKLTCLDGAIRYISDKRLGYAKVTIRSGTPALPYVLSAYTHTGEQVVLVHPLDRGGHQGSISRSMESVELRLHLSGTQGKEKHIYSILCEPEAFSEVTYEEIQAKYGPAIPQVEVDVIENGEVRYFVWTDSGQWGFSVVPVSRLSDQLRVGEQQLLPFENENWMVHYFDGTR